MTVTVRTVQSFVILVALGVVACTGGPRQRPVKGGPVDEGPGSITAARKFLEGRWTLESFEVFPPGKPSIALNGQGTLSYDDFGNLRMEIRADEKSADLLRAAGIDIRDNLISTDGRAAVDMQNRTITYLVDGERFASSSSGPLALNRPRYWQVEANQLTLTTKDANGNALSVGRWRRMP
jgi:hypothetical protein